MWPSNNIIWSHSLAHCSAMLLYTALTIRTPACSVMKRIFLLQPRCLDVSPILLEHAAA